jgi:hypothetical protein
VRESWRKLNKEELRNFSSLTIIRMTKSRRIGWARHVARMERRGMHIGYCCENEKEKDHKEDQAVGGCCNRSVLNLDNVQGLEIAVSMSIQGVQTGLDRSVKKGIWVGM